jgi:ribose-phosphate pyrophosphokinase
MQDEVFEKGEINVAENLIEKLISYYKVKKIYIIDPHSGGRKWLKKYPIISNSAIPLLINQAKKDFNENILFLSPDIGGKRRAGLKAIKKERVNSYQVKMVFPNIKLKGKVVGVIDDIIKTGGTLLKFSEIAKKSGAKKIIALVTHGVINSGISKIKEKYSKLYLTNTIKQKNANIDITNLVLNTIQKDD